MQQPQGRVFDERGDRDRDELWDASYHGDRELHQQPHCRDLCDPKDKNVGGLPKYQPGESRERSPQDALRSTNPVIPSLPPVNKRNSSIEAADWLVEVKPLIGDISNKASRWWEMTMDRTVEVYQTWLHSNPRAKVEDPTTLIQCHITSWEVSKWFRDWSKE